MVCGESKRKRVSAGGKAGKEREWLRLCGKKIEIVRGVGVVGGVVVTVIVSRALVYPATKTGRGFRLDTDG